MMNNFISIKVKYTIIIGLFTTFIMIILNLAIFMMLKDITIFTSLSNEMNELDYRAVNIQEFLEEINEISIEIMTDTNHFTQNQSRIDICNFLGDSLISNTMIHSATLIIDDNVYWSNSPNDQTLYDTLNENWFVNLLNRGYNTDFSEVHNFKRGNAPALQVVSYINSIYDSNENEVGYLLLHIKYDEFKNVAINSYDNNIDALLDSGNNILLSEKYFNNDYFKSNDKINELDFGVIKEDFDGVFTTLSNGYKLVKIVDDKIIMKDLFSIITAIFIFVLLGSFVLLFIIYMIMDSLSKPILNLTDAMENFSIGNEHFPISLNTKDELQIMCNKFNDMVDGANLSLKKQIEHDKVKKKFEFDLLMSKIHPHFIYNTLNTAIFLSANQKNEDTIIVLKSLISILHDSMSVHDDKVMDTIRNEIKIVCDYVVIQKYKYKDIFELVLEISDNCNEMIIPKNILQPLVENAIFHGLSTKEKDGVIKISIQIINETINIVIYDNGVGIDCDKLTRINNGEKVSAKASSHSIGMTSVFERINVLYDGEAEIYVISKIDEYTEITIKIPVGAKEYVQ